MPSRRRLLVAGAAFLGGCTQSATDPTASGPSPTASVPPTDSDRPSQTPTDATPSEEDRPTATDRDPRPLSVTGAWRQFGADAGHTGASSTTSFAETGVPYWKLRRVRSGSPVVADGRLYHFALLGENEAGGQTVTPTRVGTEQPLDGRPAFVCRNANDGAIEWTFEFDRRRTGWAAAGSGLVTAGFHDGVRAFDPATGRVEWHVEAEGSGSPTIAGRHVVVPVAGSVDGSGNYLREPSVQALDLATGAVRWTIRPPKRGIGVAASDDAVAVLSWDYDERGSLAVRSLVDGGERWRTSLDGFAFQMPAVADGDVYVSSYSGTVSSFALDDGSHRWRRSFERRPSGVAVDGDALYVSSGAGPRALDATTGEDVWHREADFEGSGVTPAVAGDVVYTGGDYERLRALDAATGEERWSFGFPQTVVEGDMMMQGAASQPVPVDGGLFVEAWDGLYAFGPNV